MKRISILSWAKRAAFGLLLAAGANSSASVTLNYQFISPELPPGTRCLLVASTRDNDLGQPGDLAGVSLVSGTSFGKDEVILAVLAAESLPGGFTGVSGAMTISYEGDLDEGDALTLVWLPGLASDATMLPLGGGFVSFAATNATDGGTIGYALPADGATDSIYSIATTYGGTTVFPGSVPAVVATYPHGQDSDGDQMGDLLEFVMGTDVYESSTLYQPMIGYANGASDLVFDFSLREDLLLHDVNLHVESSYTLLVGSWFPVDIQPSSDGERWEAVVPAPTGANARQFFRFKLETP